jgi:hypothetical protein
MKILLAISLALTLVISIFVEVRSKVKSVEESAQNHNTPSELVGTWGGDNLVVEINTEGATIDYGCAHGTINENIVPDKQGRFSVKGLHKIHTGGPTRQGSEEGQPAIYSGTVVGNVMSFEVKLERENDSIGKFKVEKGKQVRLRRCG